MRTGMGRWRAWLVVGAALLISGCGDKAEDAPRLEGLYVRVNASGPVHPRYEPSTPDGLQAEFRVLDLRDDGRFRVGWMILDKREWRDRVPPFRGGTWRVDAPGTVTLVREPADPPPLDSVTYRVEGSRLVLSPTFAWERHAD